MPGAPPDFVDNSQEWTAAGKDHGVDDPEQIRVDVIAIDDPLDEWEVKIWQSISDPADHPVAVAEIDQGWILTGGGAFVDYKGGAGNLLTASFPRPSRTAWEARSKDHDAPDVCSITAFAIGLRYKGAETGVTLEQTQTLPNFGPPAAHPTATASLPPNQGWILSGGGAFDDWTGIASSTPGGVGNLLTASAPPEGTVLDWLAAGKDQLTSSPASISAFAIGIRIRP